jgi:serine/threonine-protein kinase PRP4
MAKRPRTTEESDATLQEKVQVETVIINEDEIAAGQAIQDEVEDEARLEQLIYDETDDFVTVEEIAERTAQERRRQRQERLRCLAMTEETKMEPANPPSAAAPLHDKGQRMFHTSSRQGERVDLQNIERPIISTKSTTGNEDSLSPQQQQYEDDDMFDMFSSSLSPDVAKNSAATNVDHHNNSTNTTRGQEQQDWDDAEGYYKAVIGEAIPLPSHQYELRVSGVIGKGVFSTVLKCTATKTSFSSSALKTEAELALLPPTVAVKLIRHNDTMAKAALREIGFLLKFKDGKNNNSNNTDETAAATATGIVPLLLPHLVTKPLDYRGHTLLVFPYLPYNLRDVLQKFGKGVGLSLQSVQSYFGQLLSALYHLQKRNLIHADIKPDNILVSENYSTVLLCDFGSAVEMHSTDHLPTPYLVSRFYRAPEVILGLLPTPAIDLWSVAVSVAEIFLGHVVLAGTTNNDMLFLMMQQLGPFSHRLVRQHLLACQRLGLTGTAVHFAAEDNVVYHFLQQTTDAVTGQPVVRHVPLQDPTHATKPGGTLKTRLLKAKSAKDSRTKVLQFAELLQKCLALDPTRRISVKEAMHHSFLTVNEAATT